MFLITAGGGRVPELVVRRHSAENLMEKNPSKTNSQLEKSLSLMLVDILSLPRGP